MGWGVECALGLTGWGWGGPGGWGGRSLEKGDDFLVLATDGLWDVLSTPDVANLIARENKARTRAHLHAA